MNRVDNNLLPDVPWRVVLLLARGGYDPMLLRKVSLAIALEVVWCRMHGLQSCDAIAKAMCRPRADVRQAARALQAAALRHRRAALDQYKTSRALPAARKENNHVGQTK